ncbi:efflux RND transporter periplasmic adaptor subunit [Thiocystis violascens]|uniref:RND family efflux transporter, MFP subunit n=1 Tax=Thiocystis violascens (strain ATCC 17096 / DSM 198 / 6111) TaxID=765911 RepID=I3YCJ9_THIV6|nr:efflux RND transporter periplasmic adaptor subunit [Thiocystis violascens]AFL74717.1 RND family efflux transporter, MFP subunit [Thiocystis violascens DSM 198]
MPTHSPDSAFQARRSVPDAGSRGGWPVRFLVAGIALTFLGCGKPEPAATPQMPPPAVVAVAAKSQAIEDEARFVGRVVAVNRVELRARVEGFLKERRFTEGDPVAVGDVLFLIEPEQYEAVVEQRQADVTKAQADAQNAEAQLKRGQELLTQKNIAQAKVDELQAAASVAKASIAQAKAALTAAQLDLSYTRITAPVAGRIGLAQYTIGNLVSPSSGVLATIVSRDPMYVQFPLTQRELLQARRDVKERGMDSKNVVVKVRLPDKTLYEHPGRLDFVDVTTDAGTDSVILRAALPNPDGLLVDGQYVGLVLESGEPKSAILIPQSAMQIDQQGVYVLIVDGESKAQVRRVETGPVKGANIAVTKGLEEGELVIAEGIQKVRPGQVVKAAPAQAPNEGAAP